MIGGNRDVCGALNSNGSFGKELTAPCKSLILTVTGWFGQTNPFAFDPKRFDPAPSARRFQSGSPSIPNIYASVRGLELLRGIGMENVAGQVGQLTTTLLQGAVEQGIQTKTPGRQHWTPGGSQSSRPRGASEEARRKQHCGVQPA